MMQILEVVVLCVCMRFVDPFAYLHQLNHVNQNDHRAMEDVQNLYVAKVQRKQPFFPVMAKTHCERPEKKKKNTEKQ